MKVLLVIALLAVFGVLATGLLSMARGGEFNRKWSNKLMRLRVAFQAIAIAIIVLVLFFSRQH